MSFVDHIYQQGGQIFEVGGAVRDALLGHPHKDKDLVVLKIPLHQLKKTLAAHGQVFEVGKFFGVLKFKNKEEGTEYDIALPRIEKSTGLKHRDFKVEFDENLPLEIDLGRRDFTINAMAREIRTGELIDPFAGKKDLQARLLRQVFAECFVEDPLRLMRGVQFSARFDLQIESETLQAMRQQADLITTVSPERIIEEIRKLLSAKKPSNGFYLMKETGLLKHIFPELERTIGVAQPAKRHGDVFDHTMVVLDAARACEDLEQQADPVIMLAALFHDVGKPHTQDFSQEQNRTTFYGHQIVSTRLARKWLERYHANMLGINPKDVLSIIYNHMFETKSFYTDKAIRRFAQKIGPELIFKLVDFRIADKKGGAFPNRIKGVLQLRTRIRNELNKKPPFGPKDLAINGFDLMTMGYPEGPALGDILKKLVELVLDEPEKNERQYLGEFCAKTFPITGDKK